MMADVGLSELLRICCGPLNRIPPDGFLRFPVYRRNVIGIDGASCSLGFHSSRVTSAFVVDLYVGLPPVLSHWWTSWDLTGKLTNHFPEANPPATLTLERRLTVFAVARRSKRLNRRASPFRGSWHFV
jgi:hypothetical protein